MIPDGVSDAPLPGSGRWCLGHSRGLRTPGATDPQVPLSNSRKDATNLAVITVTGASQARRVRPAGFRLPAAQKQQNQYPVGETRPVAARGRESLAAEDKGTFWGEGNVSYLDEGGGHPGMRSSKPCHWTQSECILSYVNYTLTKQSYFFKNIPQDGVLLSWEGQRPQRSSVIGASCSPPCPALRAEPSPGPANLPFPQSALSAILADPGTSYWVVKWVLGQPCPPQGLSCLPRPWAALSRPSGSTLAGQIWVWAEARRRDEEAGRPPEGSDWMTWGSPYKQEQGIALGPPLGPPASSAPRQPTFPSLPPAPAGPAPALRPCRLT